MDWLFLIFLVPIVLIPIVLLCGFAGCGLDVVGQAAAPLLPPSNLSGVADGTNKIILNWTYNTAGAKFIVERAPPGGSFAPLDSNVSGTNFPDSTVTEGRTFLYQVRAFMPGAGGPPTAPSNTATVTALPATPTNLVPTLIGTSQVQLSWTNASATATKFSLEHRSSPGSAWSEIYKGTAKTSPASPLTPAGGDEYRVSAIVDGFDNSVPKEVRSNPSVPVSAITSIPITPWKTAYNIPITIDGNNGGIGWQGQCLVQVITASRLINAGSKVRITLRGPTTKNLVINKVSISQVDTAVHPWNSAADLVEVRSGGISGVTIPAGAPKTLDDTNYALDRTKNLLIAFNINSAAGNDSIGRALVPTSTMYSRQATAEALTKDPQSRSPGYLTHADSVYLVEKIEVQ
jgi:hypothetical protein